MKEVTITNQAIPAKGRSKNYRNTVGQVLIGGGGSATQQVVATGGAADTAKVAQNLAEDSTDWAKIMRKDIDDRTENSLSIGKNLGVDGRATISELVSTALSAASATIADLTATTLKATSATILGALTAATVSATTISATSFIGDLQGNAATSTKLKTPRNILGIPFDGSADCNGNALIYGTLNVNGGSAFASGAVFYGQTAAPTGLGTYVLNYVSATYGARVTAYDGVNYQKLSLGKLVSGSNFQLELNTDGTSKFNGGVITNGIESSKGGIFFGQYASMPSGLGTYVANYVSDVYGARILAYDGAAYKDLKLGAMPTSGVFAQTLLANGNVNFGYNVGVSGTVTAPTFIGDLNGNASTATKLKIARTIWGQTFDGSGNISGAMTGVGVINQLNNGDLNGEIIKITRSDATIPRSLATDGFGIGLKEGSNFTLLARSGRVAIASNTIGTYTLDVNGNARIVSDLYADATVGTRNFASHISGWRVDSLGAADFRSIYSDELRVQAFTADISQALAGSDYLTKSVSKLSANFIIPSVNGSVRIIVDDIEGMPATRCFSNGDYIRFRAFNRTSGLTIANVWGTVSLDTSFGTNGFTNGTQAYTFTCTATTGAGLTVFKGSEVLDYGTSGSGMISRTTLDAMGSPYEQIATWVNDPSNSANYTVHARLGNLNGIANCNGYGLYTDNGFFTGKIVIGDLTKNANFLSFDGVNGLQIKLGGTSVATTTDISTTNGNITTAINGIQIADRNILRKSYLASIRATYNSTTHTWSGIITATGDKYWRWDLSSLMTEQYVGQITITFIAKSTIAGQISVSTSVGTKGKNVNITTTDAIYSVVIDADFLNHSGWGGFDFSEALRGATVTIREIMISKGNIVLPYRPAIEDIESNISNAQSTAISQAASNAAAIYVTSTAYNSTVTQLQGSISSKVSQTDFNALGTRVGTAESNITQNAQAITSKVSSSDYTGANIASLINQSASTVTIAAAHINLIGAVTFNAFDTSLQTTINGKATTTYVDGVKSTAEAALTSAGTANATLVTALGGKTIIVGGYIDTSLIKANSIVASQADITSFSASIATIISLSASAITSGTFTADRIGAGIITSDKVNMTEFTASSGFVDSFNANIIATGRLDANAIVTKAFTSNTIVASNATITNLNVNTGLIYNLRSPWVNTVADLTSIQTDDAIMIGATDAGNWQEFVLDWTMASNGRNIQLISKNRTAISAYAAQGMYFYVNGVKKNMLWLNNQILELVGYGDGTTFFGWIVKSIKPFMGTQQYGKPLNILAHGSVTVLSVSTTPQISFRMFNDGYIGDAHYIMSVSRVDVARYRVTFPTEWGLGTNYIVMLTGVGYSLEDNVSPTKVTLIGKNDGYFDVRTSDDATVNEGSFEFQIFNFYDI